ncbi:hypothetical protein SAMN05216167_13322 [Spirosoma endophyticum]|uniref:Uncharacterized protein n=1 Tax=Spirosoma endophyticum TaxID=662367 RepID=A0A1I2GK98_9BACT|nr:hypothetical protein SAMN05216167_13322 [Spirosoma endophyticum]
MRILVVHGLPPSIRFLTAGLLSSFLCWLIGFPLVTSMSWRQGMSTETGNLVDFILVSIILVVTLLPTYFSRRRSAEVN